MSATKRIEVNFRSFSCSSNLEVNFLAEFLGAMKISRDSRNVDRYYREYEKYCGFPSVVLAQEELKDTILSGIFDSIVLRDVAYRSGIKETLVLRNVISFLADNVGQLVNPTNIANVLTHERVPTSNHTVNRYLELLENAFLFYPVRQYDIRGKAYLKTNAKYFTVDSGLRRHTLGKKDGNYDNRLENVVFLELLRRGYTVDVGRIDTKEIDFIARKVDEKLYVQVTYEMPESTREVDNLLLVNDNYRKIIVSGRSSTLWLVVGEGESVKGFHSHYSRKRRMGGIRLNFRDHIGETNLYDKKEYLEKDKPKSWLKSVSAFANGRGGKLIFGVKEDNSITGLSDYQKNSEFISETIKTRIDSIPEFDMEIQEIEGKHIIILTIFPGRDTPYFFVESGTRIAYKRVGNQSVTATRMDLVNLSLRGQKRSYDSLPSERQIDDVSFKDLKLEYSNRVGKAFEERDLKSLTL